MTHRRAVLATLAAAGFARAFPAFAQDAKSETLEISGGFARATPPMALSGIAYLTITSLGPADRLIGFTTAACNRPEIHTHIDDNGIMRMRQVEAVEVPAGGAVQLRPGGLHLMLIDLNEQLISGEMLEITLNFEKAGALTLSLPIQGMGSTG